MKLALLAACCTLLAFAAANAVASALFLAHWRFRRAGWMRRSTSTVLFARALPFAVSAALATLTVLPSFLAHEPRHRVESVGLPLALGAGVGLWILTAAMFRALAAIVRTRRATRAWLRDATPLRLPGWDGRALRVDGGEPGVCVVGFLRPTLLVSRGALESCTPAELAGIVAHEAAHAASLDIWKKLALCALPDVVAATPAGAAVERVWRARAEEEADRAAADGDRLRGAELAGALVKLARRRCAPALPLATAFDAGGPIERRVRRLLTGASPADDRRPARPWVALAAGVVAPALICGAFPPLSVHVHRAIELVVQALG